MKSVVIAGFAGVGKTTLAKKYKNVIDLESSPYKWDYSKLDTSNLEKLKGLAERTKNKDFPQNYINAIKKAQKSFDIVCVWIHPEEILPEYEKNGIDYVLCFPSKKALEGYRQRFVNRGNAENYINHIFSDYDKRFMQFTSNPHKQFILKEGETLEDRLLQEGYNLKR